MIRGRKSKMHRCTPIRDAWLKSAKYLGIPRKSIQRPWPGGPTRKGCRTKLLLPGNAFQRLWQGVPPGNTPEQYCYYQECISEALARGVSPGKAPEQIVLTRKCLSEIFKALARGSPQERLQNKIVITRKCLPEALARGSPQQRLQNKILITRKGSRARLLLPGNAFQRLWPRGPPQERHQKKIVFTRKCLPEALAGDPCPGRNGSRTRSFLPGNAFQRLWPGCPPGKALEQDRYYQEVPSKGSGQRVLAGREFHGTQGRARTKALRSRQNEKALGGTPLGLSGSPGPFHLSSGSSLGSLEFPPLICF